MLRSWGRRLRKSRPSKDRASCPRRSDAGARFGAPAVVVEHRIGPLELGDVSVAIVSASAHREQAIECTRFVIEEIKKRVPIWKREHYADGTREWVDPTRAGEARAT